MPDFDRLNGLEKLDELDNQIKLIENQMNLRRTRHEEQLALAIEEARATYNPNTRRTNALSQREIDGLREGFEKGLKEELGSKIDRINLEKVHIITSGIEAIEAQIKIKEEELNNLQSSMTRNFHNQSSIEGEEMIKINTLSNEIANLKGLLAEYQKRLAPLQGIDLDNSEKTVSKPDTEKTAKKGEGYSEKTIELTEEQIEQLFGSRKKEQTKQEGETNPIPQGSTRPEGETNPIPQGSTRPEGETNPIPQGPTRPEGATNPAPQGPTRPEGATSPAPQGSTRPEDETNPAPQGQQAQETSTPGEKLKISISAKDKTVFPLGKIEKFSYMKYILNTDLYETAKMYNVNEDVIDQVAKYKGDYNVIFYLLSKDKPEPGSIRSKEFEAQVEDYLSVLRGDKEKLETFELEYDLRSSKGLSSWEFKQMKQMAKRSEGFADIKRIWIVRMMQKLGKTKFFTRVGNLGKKVKLLGKGKEEGEVLDAEFRSVDENTSQENETQVVPPVEINHEQAQEAASSKAKQRDGKGER